MSLGDDHHDHMSRQASRAAGNSFDHEENMLPPPSPGRFGGMGLGAKQHVPPMSVPFPASPVQPVTDQAVAQKAAMEHQRGQYEAYNRVLPQLQDLHAELAYYRARQDLAGASSPRERMADRVLDGLDRRGDLALCRVAPPLALLTAAWAGVKIGPVFATGEGGRGAAAAACALVFGVAGWVAAKTLFCPLAPQSTWLPTLPHVAGGIASPE